MSAFEVKITLTVKSNSPSMAREIAGYVTDYALTLPAVLNAHITATDPKKVSA